MACRSLTQVALPHSVVNLESAAFAYCPELTVVAIGKNVTEDSKPSGGKSGSGYPAHGAVAVGYDDHGGHKYRHKHKHVPPGNAYGHYKH